MMRANILSLVLLAAITATAAAQDTSTDFADILRIIDDKGESLKIERAEVKSATYEKVVYDLRGRPDSEREGAQVRSIDYGDAPRVYVEGQTALRKQQYEQAASDFAGAKNAVAIKKARPWLLEYAAVGRAQALFALSAKDPARVQEAVDEYQEALAANEKSLLIDQIQLGLTRCYIRMKRWDDARMAAQKLVDVGTAIKQPVWLCLGQQALAEVLLAKGEPQDAANAYQDLVLSAQREIKWAKSDVVKERLTELEVTGAVEQGWARIARAEATESPADWSQAKSYFEGLGARYSGSDSVAAAILNGVGRCLLETDARAAAMKFAEAEVVYFSAKNEVARALYLKARAYEKLASEAGAGGSRYRTMAEEALKELREFYPESQWARK